MNTHFYPGCKALCIDERNTGGCLRAGQVYLIHDVLTMEGGEQILFPAPYKKDEGWNAERFKLVEPGCDRGAKGK